MISRLSTEATKTDEKLTVTSSCTKHQDDGAHPHKTTHDSTTSSALTMKSQLEDTSMTLKPVESLSPSLFTDSCYTQQEEPSHTPPVSLPRDAIADKDAPQYNDNTSHRTEVSEPQGTETPDIPNIEDIKILTPSTDAEKTYTEEDEKLSHNASINRTLEHSQSPVL